MWELLLVRVTIVDPEQTISFVADEETMLCFVAGCSSNPTNLGELLLATEIYRHGVATRLMAELMEFDKTFRREGLQFIQASISTARAAGKALKTTFQVVDEVTDQEAMVPRVIELVVLDLGQQSICASEGLEIPVSHEVTIRSNEVLTDKKVTYILPHHWSITPLTE
jgi:hypothetical protein